MFGLGFIFRVIIALLSFSAFVLFVVGVAYLISKLFHFAWDAFEDMFYDQAQWAIHKFHILKPWRFFTVPAITVILMLCCIASFVFVVISGGSLQGTEIK